MDCIEIFEKYAQEYDEWFEISKLIYKSEIRALKDLPDNLQKTEQNICY